MIVRLPIHMIPVVEDRQSQFYFRADTLDDLMRDVVSEIQRHGVETNPSRGGATEITGVLLELSNPRARLSRTETRGRVFSCLGELSMRVRALTSECAYVRLSPFA